jgi:hypothetical protein
MNPGYRASLSTGTEIARCGGQKPRLRIVRGLFTAFSDRPG